MIVDCEDVTSPLHGHLRVSSTSPSLLLLISVFTSVRRFQTASSASSSAPEGISHSTSYTLASCQTPQTCSKGRRVEVWRKEKEKITDTWVSMFSSSCLLSRVHAWPAGVSCRPAGVHSSAYTPASNPLPQTYP